LKVGCVIDAAVYIEKEPEKTDASKLAPIFLRFLFLRASHARGAALRRLPLGYPARLFAHTPPQALSHNNAGRPMAQPSRTRSG